MSDIVKQLLRENKRKRDNMRANGLGHPHLILMEKEAADRITELEREVSALKDYKIYGVAYQHEDTGVQGVVDIWQVEQGFFDNNPRLHEIGTVVLLPPSDGVEI